MRVIDARDAVHGILLEHNLYQEGWRFKLGRGKNLLGLCDHGKKEITISKYLIQLGTDEEILYMILHEIAHALTPGHGHDRVWRRKAREIGHPNPTRLTQVSYDTPHKVELHCKVHGVIDKRQRRMNLGVLTRSFCKKCGRISQGQLTQIVLTPQENVV